MRVHNICDRLDFLSIELDQKRNVMNAPLISLRQHAREDGRHPQRRGADDSRGPFTRLLDLGAPKEDCTRTTS